MKRKLFLVISNEFFYINELSFIRLNVTKWYFIRFTINIVKNIFSRSFEVVVFISHPSKAWDETSQRSYSDAKYQYNINIISILP